MNSVVTIENEFGFMKFFLKRFYSKTLKTQ